MIQGPAVFLRLLAAGLFALFHVCSTAATAHPWTRWPPKRCSLPRIFFCRAALPSRELEAPFHSHHFNFRLDLDIDGQNNTFVLGKLKQRAAAGPRRSIWTLSERALQSESEGRLDDKESHWKTVNMARRNAQGEPVGYVLESHGNVEPLLDPADYRRAGFIGHNLWVTAFDADERFAAGDTPNQNPGAPGLPQYIRDNQSIVNRDIVLWLSVGFHLVTQAEDWPVLSRNHRVPLLRQGA